MQHAMPRLDRSPPADRRGSRLLPFAWLALVGLLSAQSQMAPEPEESESPPAADDLAMFEDIPIVVTASRAATPINLSPAPVSVMSGDELHYGGWISLPDALQFLPGVDTLRLDRRRSATGVRGLHETFSDRTLTLVNGRRAVSVAFGGAEFHRLPLFMDDIAQVEVVRGPGGAAWGSDAMNGVINVITKDPAEVVGARLSATLTEFGDAYTQGRWAGAEDRFAWRVSFGWQDHESSKDILDLPAGTSDDSWSMLGVDTEFRYRLNEDTEFSGGFGLTGQESGGFSFLTWDPGLDHELRTLRSFARLDSVSDNGDEYFVQAYFNMQRSEAPTIADEYSEDEFALESQFALQLAEGHETTFGADYRYRTWSVDSSDPLQIHTRKKRYTGGTLGIFGVDRWRVSERTNLELQLRGDYFTEGDFDWSGRLTGLFAHDSASRHVTRVSLARAYRDVTVFGEVDLRRQPFMGSYLFHLYSADGVENESMWSVELGHSAKLSDSLQLDVDAYFQVYRDLVGLEIISLTPPIDERFNNVGQADAGGFEIEALYRRPDWSVRAWYAFNEFGVDRDGVTARGVEPSRHKAGLIGRWTPRPGMTLQTAFKYAGEFRDTDGPYVDEFFRWDLSATKRIGDFGELQIGVWDLLDDMGETVLDNASNETPGRTFFLRLQLDI